MSVISGVKPSPSKEQVGSLPGVLKKGEKPPKYGVKTDQERELAAVSRY